MLNRIMIAQAIDALDLSKPCRECSAQVNEPCRSHWHTEDTPSHKIVPCKERANA